MTRLLRFHRTIRWFHFFSNYYCFYWWLHISKVRRLNFSFFWKSLLSLSLSLCVCVFGQSWEGTQIKKRSKIIDELGSSWPHTVCDDDDAALLLLSLCFVLCEMKRRKEREMKNRHHTHIKISLTHTPRAYCERERRKREPKYKIRYFLDQRFSVSSLTLTSFSKQKRIFERERERERWRNDLASPLTSHHHLKTKMMMRRYIVTKVTNCSIWQFETSRRKNRRKRLKHRKNRNSRWTSWILRRSIVHHR